MTIDNLTYNSSRPMIARKCKMPGARLLISQIVKRQYDL